MSSPLANPKPVRDAGSRPHSERKENNWSKTFNKVLMLQWWQKCNKRHFKSWSNEKILQTKVVRCASVMKKSPLPLGWPPAAYVFLMGARGSFSRKYSQSSYFLINWKRKIDNFLPKIIGIWTFLMKKDSILEGKISDNIFRAKL